MSGDELVRHLAAGFVFLSALSFLLLHNATRFDHTEGETLAQMGVVVFATIFVMWASMRRLRARWYALATGIAIVLLALTCSHEIVGSLWVRTAYVEGDTRETLEARALADVSRKFPR